MTIAPDPNMAAAQAYSDQLQATLASAPELSSSPSAAVTVASAPGSGSVQAQSVAQSGIRQATATAYNNQQRGVLGDIGGAFSWLGHQVASGAKDVMKVVNAPLQQVQHEYRYLHDVWVHHGALASIGEGLAMLGTGAAATLATGGNIEAGVLAGEAVGGALGQVAYKDSWARSKNAPISVGRDLANLLGVKGGTKTFFSGLLDGTADVLEDPVAMAGRISGAAKGAEGLGDINKPGLAGSLAQRFPGLAMTSDNVERAALNNPGFQRFLQFAADNDSGNIVKLFPELGTIAKDRIDLPVPAGMPADVPTSIAGLGAAKTADEAAQVFRNVAASADLAKTIPGVLPRLSLTRLPLESLRTAASDASGRFADNALLGPARWARRLERLPGATIDDLNGYAGNEIDPTTDRGAIDIFRLARFGQSRDAAAAVTGEYLNADLAGRIGIYRNLVVNTLYAMAHVPAEERIDLGDYMANLGGEDMRKATNEWIHKTTGGAEMGSDGTYGLTTSGNTTKGVVTDPETGRTVNGAVLLNQTGNLTIPDFSNMHRVAQQMAQAKIKLGLGRLDDFAYQHFTQGIFKPLVLQSFGYPVHISLAEDALNTLRKGPWQMVKSRMDTATGKLLYNESERVKAQAAMDAAQEKQTAAMAAAHEKAINAGKTMDQVVRAGMKAGDKIKVPGLEKVPTASWATRLLGGKLPVGKDADYLGEFATQTEGHMTTPAMRTSHNIAAETNQERQAELGIRQAVSKDPRLADTYSSYGDENQRFAQYWRDWHREIARDPPSRAAAQEYLDQLHAGAEPEVAATHAGEAATGVLRSLSPDVLSRYIRSTAVPENAPAGWDPLRAWGQDVAENMRAATHGRDGTIHEGLIDQIAKGKGATQADLQGIDPVNRPLMVKGRDVMEGGSSSVQKVANYGFRKIMNPMVDFLSREPLGWLEYRDQRRLLEPDVEKGIFSTDEAATIAAARATTRAVRFIHNIHDRTQWSTTMRNYAPFYFAQEQAYRRAGRLLADDPGAFRQYQLAISGVHNIATSKQDVNGNQYAMFPMSGFISTGMQKAASMVGIPIGTVIPAAFGGTLTSASVVFPMSNGVTPNAGPVAIVPAHLMGSLLTGLSKKYPSFAPVGNVAVQGLTDVVGSNAMSGDLLNQLIPNTFVQRVVETAQGDDRAMNSSGMQALAALWHEQQTALDKWQAGGQKGPEPQIVPDQTASPMVKQAFIDKLHNQTRVLYFTRALIGLASPVSAEVKIQDWGLPAALQADIQAKGSVTQGVTKFLADHPDGGPFTVFHSTSPTGTSWADSKEAQSWIAQNDGFINQFQHAAPYMMPQLTDTKYDSAVYNEQLAMGLREMRSPWASTDDPQSFLGALYTMAGNAVYYDALSQHEAFLASASPAGKAQEYGNFDSFVQTLQQQAPVWADNFFSASKQTNRQQTIQELHTIYASKLEPNTAQGQAIGALLQQYDVAAAAFAKAGQGSNYSSAQADVRRSWQAYLLNVEAQVPQLKPVIQGVFRDALYVQT